MEVPTVRQHQDKHVQPFHLSNLNRLALGKYYSSIYVEIALEGSKSSVRSYLLLTNAVSPPVSMSFLRLVPFPWVSFLAQAR